MTNDKKICENCGLPHTHTANGVNITKIQVLENRTFCGIG